MPFTTALIGGSYDGTDEAVAVSVYALNVGLAALADSLMDRIVITGGLAMPSDPVEQRAQLVGGWLRTGIFFDLDPDRVPDLADRRGADLARPAVHVHVGLPAGRRTLSRLGAGPPPA